MTRLTKTKIANHLFEYFERRFPALAGQIDSTSNIKVMCNFTDMGWADLATSVFNRFSWMAANGILLSQLEVAGAVTIQQLTNLIWAKYVARQMALASRLTRKVAARKSLTSRKRAPARATKKRKSRKSKTRTNKKRKAKSSKGRAR